MSVLHKWTKAANAPKHYAKKWKMFWADVAEQIEAMKLWGNKIKKIEGKFGSEIGTYFVLLRWAFVISLTLSLVYIGAVVVPFSVAIGFAGDGKNSEIVSGVYGPQREKFSALSIYTADADM